LGRGAAPLDVGKEAGANGAETGDDVPAPADDPADADGDERDDEGRDGRLQYGVAENHIASPKSSRAGVHAVLALSGA
jgi:hypothetical protein